MMISPEDLIKIYQKYDNLKSRKHLIFIDSDRNYDDSHNEGCRYRRYPLP